MMNLSTKKLLGGLFVLLFICQISFAQTKLTGVITDAVTKEPLVGVSVQVKGKVIGTITDLKGHYALTTTTATPFVLLVTSVGYESQEITINSNNESNNVALKEQAVLGQEVVVAASRIEESVLQSPVTIEKMDIRNIRETPSASFYDGLANMKGIDMATQGVLFKSINMRGFGATGNPRTVQLIDGMDNSAPGLNFPVDNIIGMPELDVESVEILPGAASALYGPNALNGLIMMNSKSPFLYQGLSAAVKVGAMSANNRDVVTTPYTDYSIRYAKAFNNKFAFKLNFGYIEAKDWQATNYENLNLGGVNDPTRKASGVNSDYDGMNSYGDEIQRTIAGSPVSRTGYLSKDLLVNDVKSLKFNGALHYRLSEKVEAIAQYNYGLGTTPYTGAGQYNLRNLVVSQAKLELRGDNFLLRGYTTQENSGDTYAVGLAGTAMIRAFKSDDKWFADYTTGGRTLADAGMPQPGTAAFNTLLSTYSALSINKGGGAFEDKSNLYHLEGNYNFKNQIKFVELLIGGNYRVYNLQSNGTLFSDLKEGRTGSISIDEYGYYAQAGKKLFGDHLKLSASLRYDKNKNFEGQFSPRVSAVTTFGEHNFRVAYQTGFRIPTTQNQYIDLSVPGAGTLIGGLPEFDARYNLASGVNRTTLAAFGANPTPYITADVLAKAQAYATAAVVPAVTAQVQAGVLAAVTSQVTAGVTTAVTASVTSQVTTAVTTQVTTLVTTQVNAAVAAGTIAASAAAAAIQAGVTQQMATSAVQSTIATNIASTLASPAVQSTIATNVAGTLASPAVQATIATNVAGTLASPAIQATIATNVGAVTRQVAPAYALATLPKYVAKPLLPEKIQSIEFGYKGVIAKRLMIDASYYNSVYKNFIGGVTLVVPTAAAGPGLPIESGLGSGNLRVGYSRPANTSNDITVTGFAISANYALAKGYLIGGNFANNQLKNFVPSNEMSFANFNTPENRFNVNFGKRILAGEKFGFNVAYKYQDSYQWQSTFDISTTASVPFYTNTIVPSMSVIDAQVSYKLSGIKSILKVGGTNLFGKPYFQAYGSASAGSLYYVSITFDELLNK